jgi:hypothetical protein
MQLTLESIQLDAGMQNASGTALMAIGGNPVRIQFTGTIKVLGDAPTQAEPEAPAAVEKANRPYKPREAKAKPTTPPADREPTWNDCILQALEGGNLTTSELLDHVMWIRNTPIHTIEERRVQMMRLQAAMTKLKQTKQVVRVLENNLDKWKAAAAR